MKLLIWTVLTLTTQAFATSPTAREIVLENEQVKRLNGIQCSATLTTGGGEFSTKIKTLTWWRKPQSDQLHYNTLVKFHQPAEIRGEGILFLEHTEHNEILMYLPRFKKTRRIEAKQQSESFMGSELSYSDIATPHVDDFKHRLIKEENCPTEEAALIKCYTIESIPISENIMTRTGYSRLTQWIRADNFMDVKIEYYDLENVIFKKMESFRTELVDPKNKKWINRTIRIDNLKTQRYSLFALENIKILDLNDFIFSMQNLSREGGL